MAELQQEIHAKPPEIPAPSQKPGGYIPEAKDAKPSPPRPDFKAALKERVLAKKEEEPKPEPKPEPEAKKVVTFEAKVPAKKEAVSADDAPPPVKQEAPAEVPEEQRKVLPHDKPDTARRIKAILAERDLARQEAAAAKAEYEAAKKAPSTPPEELQKLKTEHETAQGELMRLRRLHEIEKDPEFTTKYREPVKHAEKVIEDTLKKYNFSDGTLKAIANEGGFGAFSASNKTFTVQEADPENPDQTRPVVRTAAELARTWLASLPVQDSEAIRATIGKQALLRSEETAAIQKAQEEAKGYFENQTKAQREASEKAQQAQQQTMKEYSEWLKQAEEGTEFLKDRPVPESATEEQKAQIADYNEFSKQLRDRLRKDPTNAKEYGELKLEAAEAHHLRRTLGEKDAEIAALKEQLTKTKGAMRTTPKGGSLLKGPNGGEEKKAEVNMSDPMAALRQGLRKRMLVQDEE